MQHHTGEVYTGNASSYPIFGEQNKLCTKTFSCLPYTFQPLLNSLLDGEDALIKSTGCLASAAQLLPVFKL